MSKYGNRKAVYCGKVFDSMAERDRYIELSQLERAGKISDLRCQPRFKLIEKQHDERPAYYTADFEYIENGVQIVEDVKSEITAKKADYILRRKLFKQNYPEIEFREVSKKCYRRKSKKS